MKTFTMIAFAFTLLAPVSAQEVLHEFYGRGEKYLYRSVGSIADLDGDGVRDLVLGAFGGADGVGGQIGGVVQVVSGASGGLLLPEIEGPTAYLYGWHVNGMGDFDGDGTADFLSGNPQTHPCLDGEVNFYSGASGSLLAHVTGPSAYDCMELALGRDAVELGDLDQDGYPEVAVSWFFSSMVFIVGGPDGALKRVHRGAWESGYSEPGVGETGIASVGDIDQDGVPDYAIGYSQGPGNVTVNGLVMLFSGSTGEEIYRVLPEDPVAEKNSALGRDVATMGDLDLDGIPDFAASAPFSATGCQSSVDHGFTRLYSGATGAIIRQIESPHLAKWGGECPMAWLEGGEDVNGDGLADLMANFRSVKVPGDCYYGACYGAVAVYSGASGAMLWYVHPGGVFQNSFRLLGDMTGDGLSEFGVVDSDDSTVAPLNGKITIFRGSPGDAFRVRTPTTNSAGTQAILHLDGPISVGNNRLALRVTDALPGAAGAFFFGRHRLDEVLGDGELCIGALGVDPLPRIGAPVVVEPDGSVYHPVDMTRAPLDAGPLAWEPGVTWVVQFRYADPGSAGAHAVSDAFEITFTP